MHGVHSRQAVASAATAPNRWRDLDMTNRHVLRPTADVAVISYGADVTREDGEPYSALVSSGYVLRQGRWKLAFHQHSPVDS